MIISLYAGLLALIYVGLSAYVIKGRFKNKVALGDNNNADMLKRIRVHGNFIEYVPLAVFMIFLTEVMMVEQLSFAAVIVHILGIMLVAGRLLHIYGVITKDGASPARAAGMLLTFFVLIIAALYNIFYYLFG